MRTGTVLTAVKRERLSRTPSTPAPKLRMSEGSISPETRETSTFLHRKNSVCEKYLHMGWRFNVKSINPMGVLNKETIQSLNQGL